VDSAWYMNDNAVPPRARRILVADSERSLRAMLVALLESDGYEVIEAADGFELLQSLEASLAPEAEAWPYDLVICDAQLPGKTGLHVFALLGGNPDVPPVVFTTTRGDEATLHEARRLVALAVLEKPVNIDELLSLVHRYVVRGTA
jgi:CheY-like chemotaxis protein